MNTNWPTERCSTFVNSMSISWTEVADRSLADQIRKSFGTSFTEVLSMISFRSSCRALGQDSGRPQVPQDKCNGKKCLEILGSCTRLFNFWWSIKLWTVLICFHVGDVIDCHGCVRQFCAQVSHIDVCVWFQLRCHGRPSCCVGHSDFWGLWRNRPASHAMCLCELKIECLDMSSPFRLFVRAAATIKPLIWPWY